MGLHDVDLMRYIIRLLKDPQLAQNSSLRSRKRDVELGERFFKTSNIYNIPMPKDARCLRESEAVVIYTL